VGRADWNYRAASASGAKTLTRFSFDVNNITRTNWEFARAESLLLKARDETHRFTHPENIWQQFPESNEYVDTQRVARQRLLSSLR
jgi:hypothetical protein